MKAEWTNKDVFTQSETTGLNSKAILVIDMPENNAEIFERVFGVYAEEFWSFSEKQMLDFINKKPNLRPLPKKREPKEEWLNEYHRDDFADGWNAYRNELLEEEE